MSTSPDEQDPTRHCPDPPEAETEAVAAQLVALVEEFEAALIEGNVPPAFTERLGQLRQHAERLI
jgi:hypothetical protein